MSATPARWLCLAVTFAVLGGVAAGQGSAPRFRFQQGEKLRYVLEQEVSMTIAAGEQQISVKMNQVMDATWEVGAVDQEGKARITQTIDRIRSKVEGPAGKMDIDTQAPAKEDNEGQVMGKLARAMIGENMTLTMDPRGRTSNFKVSEKFQKAVQESPLAALLGSMFTEKGLEQMLSRAGVIFPEGKLTKGQAWSANMEMPMPPVGKMLLTTRTTYEGVQARNGKELVKLSLAPEVKFEADKEAPITMQVKEQEAKGTAWFDAAAGRLVETDVAHTMLMTGEGMGQTYSNRIKQRTTFKLVDAK